MSFRGQSVPVRAAGAEWSRLGDDFVVLDPSGQVLRGLNATGARVWELIDGVRSAEDIARHLATDYDQPEAQVLAGVLAFLDRLAERGLVTAA